MTVEIIESVDPNCETVNVSLGEKDYVSILEIDRPEKQNALNATAYDDFGAVHEVIAEQDVRVVVLTESDKGNSFVTGADVIQFCNQVVLEQRDVSQQPPVYEKFLNPHNRSLLV